VTICAKIEASLNELKSNSEIFSVIYESQFFKKQYERSEIEDLQCWLGVSFSYITSFDKRFFNKKSMKDNRNEEGLNNYVASLVAYYKDFYMKNNIQILINTTEDDIFSVVA